MRVAAVGTRPAVEEAPNMCPRNTQQPSSVRASVATARQLHTRGVREWAAGQTEREQREKAQMNAQPGHKYEYDGWGTGEQE